MRTMDVDAFAMMRRLVSPMQRAIVLDIGGNTGQTCRRVREVFPSSRIFTFEPGAAASASLKRLAAEAGDIEVIQAAASERDGTAEFFESDNSQMSSLLEPSDAGVRYYGEEMRPKRRVSVPTLSLDTWFAKSRLPRVDLMKVDVQGAELAVLRGARELLGSFDRTGNVLAINCEAQIVPEYQGSSTLFAINAELEHLGFQLHQIHEIWAHGVERQHSVVDALWIRREALTWLRENDGIGFYGDWRRRFRNACDDVRRAGRRSIAAYGAGLHTEIALADRSLDRSLLSCIIDDAVSESAPPRMVGGLPVLTRAQALARGIDSIVLSSNVHDEAMWWATADLRERGIDVRCLYGPYHVKSPAAAARCVSGAALVDPVRADSLRAATAGAAGAADAQAAFRSLSQIRVNQRRLEHLAQLGLPLDGQRVLEVGAGVGDLTGFFIDRGCYVLSTDARPEHVEIIAREWRRDHRVTTARLDLDDQPQQSLLDERPRAFDVAFCFGVLNHLRNPARAIEFLAEQTSNLLLLETCVSYGHGEHVNSVPEDASIASLSTSGTGCRPTRAWVMAQLREHFPHVYVTRTQPRHEEFPIDWRSSNRSDVLTRAVFVASRKPLVSPWLTEELPDVHVSESRVLEELAPEGLSV
jgi:FkbM family methyltransferase